MSALSKLTIEEKKQISKLRVQAVRQSLKKERELVMQGKGTREWTLQQQQDILDGKRPCDENGIPYEGHHMKSVSEYPEYAGYPNNIQWLSYDEHINGAHKGNTHNPTNGYYNPDTNTMHSYEGMAPVAPEVITLKQPLAKELALKQDETLKIATNETSEIVTDAVVSVIRKGVVK